mmetsp:Transcript_8893/g.10167  ORF Transcript_8893/g.10167 Transcript_8893/m.10167 type:complete len:725 (-) Transcript_8893:77-2251(-)
MFSRLSKTVRSSSAASFLSRSSYVQIRCMSNGPRTLFDKVWDAHVIEKQDDGTCLIYIDRHLVHEVTSPQAFEGLRNAGRDVRSKSRTLVTPDHNVSTEIDRLENVNFTDAASKEQVETLDMNAKAFGLPYFPLSDKRQGIVHIVGPEQGFSQPGLTLVCGDSHTSTHGAFGALAFGIGTSEVEHVLATQTLIQKPAKNMRISINGELPLGVTSKDIVLHIIGEIGTAGGTGYVMEFAGSVIRNLSMEARMTICNMAIEGGARAGMIAPDEITFNYMIGRPMAPKGEEWDKAVEYWKTLPADEGAVYDKEIVIEGKDIAPQVTWGTNPEMVAAIDSTVPNPSDYSTSNESDAIQRALDYMGLAPGQRLDEVAIDKVFVGSCTNGRIEDLRAVAEVVKGQKVSSSVKAAMVVPGSGLVKKQAEEEGIADILIEAGFDWRAPGCSMCLGMNADQLEPGERCASTSNRNFEGRQGRLGRTHLVSPAMAAAAAITGKLTDIRKFQGARSFSTRARGYSTTASAGGMQAFTQHSGVAAPMPTPNVDTDMIIPAIYLKTIKRSGLGVAAFAEMRYQEDGSENPEFVLNKPEYRSSSIIVAGDNFGCGSSREHAPWALLDFGIRCVISTSFADIFFNNCFKNGILPIRLDQEKVDLLMQDASSDDESERNLSVDLEKQVITRSNGDSIPFDVEEFRRYCLLNGLDDIGLTLQKADKIAEYEQKMAEERPWI